MHKTMLQILRVRAAVQVNTFAYYFKRLWLIGKWLPDSVYGDAALKNILSGLVTVLSGMYALMKKAAYIGLMVWLPVFLMGQADGGMSPAYAAALMAHILFLLSCIGGPLMDSEIFRVNRQKLLCLKYFRMNPVLYVRSMLLMKYIPFFLSFLPFMLLFFLIGGMPAGQVFVLWLLLIAYRFIGEAVQLFVYDRSGKVFSRLVLPVWLMIGLVIVAAYLPLLLSSSLLINAVILHPVFVVVSLAAGSACIYWVGFRYKHYYTTLLRTLDSDLLYSEAKKKARKNTFADVAMKDSDLDTDDADNAGAGKTGYAYLNAIFFARHRRQIWKPVLRRLGIVALAFVAGAALIMIVPEQGGKLGGILVSRLPLFVFVMYLISTGARDCRAMFYNCDMSLLRYGFYRRPGVILSNFRIRLMHVGGHNLLIGLAMGLAVLFLTVLSGGAWATLDMAMFFVCILFLSIFFSVHHMFLYYVFQPYTTELNVKNPFFQVLNSIVYILSYISMQLETGNMVFALIVLGFTVIYTAAALVLVYRFAPRTFRVK